MFFLNGALFGAWAARIPAVQGRLSLGEGELAVALAFLAVGSLLAMPLAGRWAARAGSRRATRGFFAAHCVAIALVTLAPGLAALCVGTFLVGASGGGLDVVMNAQGTTVERHSGRLLLSALHAAFSAGGLAGAALAALAALSGIDVRVQLAAAALVAAVAGLMATRHLLARETDAAPEGPSFARPDRGLWALGAGLSVIIPLVFRAASTRGATSSGPPLAAVATMGYLGFLAGPPLVGALAELTSLTVALGVVALLVATPIALAGAGAPAPAHPVVAEA